MFDDDNGEYFVVVNSEEQYSIWPIYKDIPGGWSAVGPKRKRQDCLKWIGENWTDMRPKSLREASATAEKSKAVTQ